MPIDTASHSLNLSEPAMAQGANIPPNNATPIWISLPQPADSNSLPNSLPVNTLQVPSAQGSIPTIWFFKVMSLLKKIKS